MARSRLAAASRASTWSSRPLFDQFPAVLVVEILSHHDARSLANAAIICRDFAGSVTDAISARVARCGGSLRLPRPVAGEGMTKRLRLAERVGPTGLAWEVCEDTENMRQWLSDEYDIVIFLRHRASGLALLLPEGSATWCALTLSLIHI